MGVGSATLGAQAGKTRGLAKAARVPGVGPQAPGFQAPGKRKMPLLGGPVKGLRVLGAGVGKAQGFWMAKLLVWDGAGLAAQGTQVSQEGGLLRRGRMTPLRSLGVWGAREPGRA